MLDNPLVAFALVLALLAAYALLCAYEEKHGADQTGWDFWEIAEVVYPPVARLILASGGVIPIALALYSGWANKPFWVVLIATTYATLAQMVRTAPTHGARALARGWDIGRLTDYAKIVAAMWLAILLFLTALHYAAFYIHRAY